MDLRLKTANHKGHKGNTPAFAALRRARKVHKDFNLVHLVYFPCALCGKSLFLQICFK